MTFAFKPCTNPEIAKEAYELPALPPGTCFNLRKKVAAYADAIRDGTNGTEDEPYSAISTFKANSLSDVITKKLMEMHFDNRGLDGDRLVLAVDDDINASERIKRDEAILADLYGQLPQDWSSALGAYRATVLAESDYDRRVWSPNYAAEKAGGVGNSPDEEKEMERLQDIRFKAEALLLDIPAPSLSEFAIKYLICFDRDRDCNGYHEMLSAEAKRLLNVVSHPDASELEAMLDTLNWRARA